MSSAFKDNSPKIFDVEHEVHIKRFKRFYLTIDTIQLKNDLSFIQKIKANNNSSKSYYSPLFLILYASLNILNCCFKRLKWIIGITCISISDCQINIFILCTFLKILNDFNHIRININGLKRINNHC